MTKHKQSCQSSKKRLSTALDKAKELWRGSKRRRTQYTKDLNTGTMASGNSELELRTAVGLIIAAEPPPQVRRHLNIEDNLMTREQIAPKEGQANGDEQDDLHLSIMERQPWKKRLNRRLPQCFRDLIPQALPFLPPPQLAAADSTSFRVAATISPQDHTDMSSSSLLTTHDPSLVQRIRSFFSTQRNIFGLSRRYSTTLPDHDPEEHITLNDLSDIIAPAPLSNKPDDFYPYPNHSSFLLGDWFWTGGIQKSQESFKDLLKIIGDPDFNASDIRNTRWDHINDRLGSDENEHGWTDDDAGWIKTPVTISVPHQVR